MAYKMNENQVYRLKEAARGAADALNSVKVESENHLTWAPFIMEKSERLQYYADQIKRIAEEAMKEEEK